MNVPDARALNRAVGGRIMSQRKHARINQAELGKLVGLSRASISNIENGRQAVTIQTLWLISQALHVDLPSLIPKGLETSGEPQGVPKSPSEQQWIKDIELSYGNP